MGKGINKVILIGNLGADPDIRAVTAGTRVANLSVATSDSWKNKETGANESRTEWHKVVFFNKVAEICERYLHKGSKVYIEGKLRTRKWQDKNGIDRYQTEVIGSEMQMLDSRSADSRDGSVSKQQTIIPQEVEFMDDDIPF